MGTVKKFIVTKEQISGAITYLEYENINGVSFSPKNKKIDSDMINVSKVVVINPSLIEKLIDKKCNKQLERIIKLLTTLYNDTDGDGDTNLGFVLNEIEKFRQLIDSKYKEYMKAEKYKTLKKKLDIIDQEVKLRRNILKMKELNSLKTTKKGKGR